MIRVIHVRGIFAPVCVCDICGQKIPDAGGGLALYPQPGADGTGETVEVLHVHKGTCDSHATEKYGDEGGTDELGTHLVWLMNNVGLRGKELKRLIDQVEEYGL